MAEFEPTEGLFPETAESVARAREALVQRNVRLRCAYYNLFRDAVNATQEDAELVWEDFERMTDRQVSPETFPHGAVFREGQRNLFREIREKVQEGERLRHGR